MSAELVGKIVTELVENGVKVELFSKPRIPTEEGGNISGGFSEEIKLLEVAAGRPDWLLILAHEYCHFKQSEDGIMDDLDTLAAYYAYDPWINKQKDFDPETVKRIIRTMQWVEWENEHRTVDLLDEYEVDYDRERYIKKTNTYLLSYELVRKYRKWTETPLYDNEKILALVPGDKILSEKEWNKIPEGFEELALPHFFEKAKDDFEEES